MPFDESDTSARPEASDQPWTIFDVPLEAWEARTFPADQHSSLAAALAAALVASEVLLREDLDQMLKHAVELIRNAVGLERVALYLRARCPERLLLRGSWGTGAQGQTTDEHELSHELCIEDGTRLQGLRAAGACSLYRPRATWYALENGQPVVLGEGWVMVTPLLHGNDLVGVMYNDAALSGDAVEPTKQAAAALFASFVSIEYVARACPSCWPPLRARPQEPRGLARRVRDALDVNLSASGNELAARFDVSPGHLARVFKREVGMSLVEYRNRKRIQRFSEALDRHGRAYSLKQAAFEAGFGSYAQFCRVHKQLRGAGPQRDQPPPPALPPARTKPPLTSWPPPS